MDAPARRRPGRQSTFSKAKCDLICARLGAGEALATICEDEGMPSVATWFRWLDERPDLREDYTRAREAQAEHMDRLIWQAATQPAERITITGKDGKSKVTGVDNGDVQHRRLLVDTLKWRAAHLRPKVYGVIRVEAEHDVSGSLAELVRQAAALPLKQAEVIESKGPAPVIESQ